MIEDDLKRLWSAATTGAAGPHLHDDTLVAFSAGELSDAARLRAADHVMSCRECSEAVQALHQARRALMASPHPVVVKRALQRSVWLPVAASVMFGVLAVGAWLSVRQPPPSATVTRSETSAVAPLIADGETLQRTAFTLRWEAPQAAAEARVILFSTDTTVVYRAEHLTGNSLTIPVDALASIAPDTNLFWMVEVTVADGRVLASESRLVRVR